MLAPSILRRATIEPMNLWPHVAYKAVVGSRAYGLDTDQSDTDKRGWYLPPASVQWSLDGAPEQIEDEPNQETYWELAKFLRLALQANPNVLETLYSPIVEFQTPLAEELRAQRSIFLSKLAYDRYLGYSEGQFTKLNHRFETKGEMNWKHAMHLIRLLISGTHLMREGDMLVDVSLWREELLTIKRGELPWEQVGALRSKWLTEMEAAYKATPLRESPNRQWAEAFLYRARLSAIDL